MAVVKVMVDAGGADKSVKLKITRGDDEPREVLLKEGSVESCGEVEKDDKLTLEVLALYETVYNKDTMSAEVVEVKGAEPEEVSAKKPKSESAKEESGAASAYSARGHKK